MILEHEFMFYESKMGHWIDASSFEIVPIWLITWIMWLGAISDKCVIWSDATKICAWNMEHGWALVIGVKVRQLGCTTRTQWTKHGMLEHSASKHGTLEHSASKHEIILYGFKWNYLVWIIWRVYVLLGWLHDKVLLGTYWMVEWVFMF